MVRILRNAAAIPTLFLVSAAVAAEPVKLSGRTMGTIWSVKFIAPAAPVNPADIGRAVTARLEQLEQIFSTYRPQSAISGFNTAVDVTEWIHVPAELATVVADSRRISEITGGAYDITIQPLLHLWRLGGTRGAEAEPEPAAIRRVRSRVDWRQIESRMEPPALRRLRPGVSIDTSSMAKGFAVDTVSELLMRFGVTNHLVAIGGDMRAAGIGPAAGGWRVAVERPVDPTGIAAVITLRDAALSTSGNHRNFARVAGRRVGHILDPRSGRPVEDAPASVSVIHESCATSSALATAMVVLGVEEGMRFAGAHGVAALFLVHENGDIDKMPTAAWTDAVGGVEGNH